MHYGRSFSKEKINIILVGATGVGKSLLINAIYGENIVKSGDGEPITQFIQKIEIPSKGLTLWDTKGIEAKDYKDTKEMLTNDITNKFWLSNPSDENNEAPHVIWLCIKESSRRIEEREHDLIKIAKEFGVPIVIVFTNTQDENSFDFFEEAKRHLNEQHKSFIKDRYVRVNSIPYSFRGTTIPICGLEELINWTEDCFGEGKENISKRYFERIKIKINSTSRLVTPIAIKPRFWGLFS